MKKLILISLCVLLVVSTSAFGTTWSYSISGKVKAGGVGVNAASVSHYVTWSDGTNTGGGVGPTLADGSFSASMSQSNETYIGRNMQLLASKGMMYGSKSWVCAATSEIKNVDIYYNVAVNPDLRFGTTPVNFAGETLIAPSTAVAFVEPDYTGELQIQGFTTILAYDPLALTTDEFSIVSMQSYSFFDVTIASGIIEIHAEVDPMGPPIMLGNVEYPTPLYEITWTANDTGTQYVTSVQTEMVEMNLGATPPGIPSVPVPHTADHLVGDAETCQATFMLDKAAEWQEALDGEWPQLSLRPIYQVDWEEHMAAWLDPANDKEGENYPENEFLPAELWVYDGNESSTDPLDPCDPGLVMYWGDETTPDGNYATAWRYDYGLDPDLRNSIIKITVTAPQWGMVPPHAQVNAVSFAINDVAGLRRWWWWNCGAPGSGQPIIWNQPTTVTIDTSKVGLNATTPAATGYLNNPGFNLAQAQSFDVDENFQWVFQPQNIPPPGQPTFVGMWNYWHNLLVVNKTPPVAVTSKYHVKWSQRPDVIDDGNPKYILGWDEISDYNNWPIMADDWLCEDDRPVTDVHWWGSYIGWTQPYPPPIVPQVFHIGIWTDVPVGAQGNDFSHPGKLIWENYCDNWVWNFFGYDVDPRKIYEEETCFQFNQLLSEDEWFKQEPNEPWPWGENPPDPFPNGNVYWLSISAIYAPGQQPLYPWGWKTRQPHWNDDAVRITGTDIWPVRIGSTWTSGTSVEEPLEPGTDPISWDLAFELTTNEGLSADLYPDGIVDFKDLAVLADQWLATIP